MSQAKYHLRIQPKRNLLDVNLKELWNYRDMIALFIRRDFVSVYKQTILGPLWFVIQPILNSLMYTLIFGNFAKFPTGGLPGILFYFTGVVAWNYFSTCLIKTSDTFISNAAIFGKVYFPRMAVPVSVTISTVVQFAIQFGMLLLVMAGFTIFKGTTYNVGTSILLLPFLLLIIAGMALGFGIIISSLTTKYRDLKQLIAFAMQLWMFATPVLYPLSFAMENVHHPVLRALILANPLSGVMEAFRAIVLGVGEINYTYLCYDTAVMFVLLAIGMMLFSRVEKNFMDHV